MASPVKVLRETETAGYIYDLLKEVNFNGFPIVDEFDPNQPEPESFGILKGLILRHQLVEFFS
jgi:hypothetical protein